MLHYFAILTANRMDNYDVNKVYKPVFASIEVNSYVYTHKDFFISKAIENAKSEVGSFLNDIKVDVVYSEYYTISDMNDIFRKDSLFGNAYLVLAMKNAAESIFDDEDNQ